MTLTPIAERLTVELSLPVSIIRSVRAEDRIPHAKQMLYHYATAVVDMRVKHPVGMLTNHF